MSRADPEVGFRAETRNRSGSMMAFVGIRSSSASPLERGVRRGPIRDAEDGELDGSQPHVEERGADERA